MRRILKTVLLLAVLCLAGCKEDQSVSFTVHEAEVDCEGTRLTIGIQANCPWTITDEANKTITDQKTGTGSITTQVAIFSSSSYDDQTYRVIITSEDGSSSDVLTIRQKAKPAILADNIGLISEEGGTFDIPVKTNDNITSVDTPDWITFTSSRALTGYTYTFTAEPNKTGAVRKGTVSFKGSAANGAVEVTQDSYAPTGIDLEKTSNVAVITFMEGKNISYPVSIPLTAIPEYADPSKLTVQAHLALRCNASIKDGNLILQFEQGVMGGGIQQPPVYFYRGEELIATMPIRTVSGDIHFYTGKRRFAVGEEFSLKATVAEEDVEISLSDESMLEYLGNWMFRALKEGTCTVSCTNKWSGKTVSTDITVEDLIVDAYMEYCYDWGSMWDVSIVGEVRGKGITEYSTCFVDGNRAVQTPLNKISGVSDGTDYLKNSFSFTIIAQNRSELEYKISQFTFHAEGTRDGKKFSVKEQVRLQK